MSVALSSSIKSSRERLTELLAIPRNCIRNCPFPDRGRQYTCDLYRAWYVRHGIARSMGRVGNSYDNEPAESVFATIKRGLPVTYQLVSRREMRDRLYDYIDRFYNCDRLHSSLS